jgi:hypothetical protein
MTASTSDQRNTLKERIRWELRRLDEREKAMIHKKAELTAYVAYLEKTVDEVKQTQSLSHLEKIVTRTELDTRVRPDMFKMSRYFAEKELEQRLEKGTREREILDEEMRKIRDERQSANLCPECNGEGKLRETRYVREDGMVRPMPSIMDCPLCEGKGRIEY